MTLNGGRLQVGVCVCRGNCLVGLGAGCCTSMLVCMGWGGWGREEEGGGGREEYNNIFCSISINFCRFVEGEMREGPTFSFFPSGSPPLAVEVCHFILQLNPSLLHISNSLLNQSNSFSTSHLRKLT